MAHREGILLPSGGKSRHKIGRTPRDENVSIGVIFL
jgi:hypothetical protein